MATKRMFSSHITESDAFLDMPLSSQALYFHLGMEADDDGFIGNPKRIQRIIGGNEDDIKVLIGKKFLIAFEDGIVVVKHHRINNNWDRHNCKRTTYLDHFNRLHVKENKAYTLDGSKGPSAQSVFSLESVFRREENRIEEKRGEESKDPALPSPSAPKKEKSKGPEKVACGEFKNVFLTLDEKRALVDRFGFATAKQLVTSADLYIGSTGTKYKSHYLTILNWARKDRVPERRPEVKPDEVPEVPLSPDQEKKMAEMRAKISEMVRTKKFSTQ